jgi:hypothetical protein
MHDFAPALVDNDRLSELTVAARKSSLEPEEASAKWSKA